MHRHFFQRLTLSFLKWGFSLALLYYVLQGIDAASLISMLQGQPVWAPLAVIALMLLQMAISTFRWQRLLALMAARAPYGLLFRFNYISLFFTCCLPGTIGADVVRGLLLRKSGVSFKACAHSVILDRLVAVAGIVAMVLIALPWLAVYFNLPDPGVLITVALLLVIAGFILLAKLPQLLAPYAIKPPVAILLQLLESAQRLVFSPRHFWITLAQAMFAHGCFCLAATLLVHGLGASFSLADSLILIPPVLLLMMLPVSVGGWGVREVSMVGFMASAGISQDVALAVSIQLGMLNIIASLPGAYLYARRSKFTGF